MTDQYCWNDKVILVVEDDTSSLLLLQAILARTGVRLLFTDNGDRAVTLIESNHEIDMVLMDIKLQGLNGYDATTRIKKIKPDTPIIAQTACAIMGDREKCYSAGCDAYLSKPISANTLLETINFYFQRSCAQNLFASEVYTN